MIEVKGGLMILRKVVFNFGASLLLHCSPFYKIHKIVREENTYKNSYKLISPSDYNQLWRALAFVPLLMSSPLTKIGITYAQILQEETIFSLIPWSEWLAQWSLKYTQECSEIWVKTCSKIFLSYFLVKIICLSLSLEFFNWKQGQSLQQNLS